MEVPTDGVCEQSPVYLYHTIRDEETVHDFFDASADHICFKGYHCNYYDRLFQAWFPIFSTVCLELSATNNCDQSLPVCY